MKKIITVANQKGGVAKSTTVTQIGAYLAKQGKRTLLIDLDPQCSLSLKFLKMTRSSQNDYYVPPLHPEDNVPYSSLCLFTGDAWAPYPTKTPNLSILPAASEMFNFKGNKQECMESFLNFMDNDAVWEHYDVIVFDTPPSKTIFPEAAIFAATHILIPCPMEKTAFEGLFSIIQFIHNTNEPRSDRSEIIGVLPTLYRAQVALHKAFMLKLHNNALLTKFATPFEMKWRPAYQEVEMYLQEQPYDIKPKGSTKDCYEEWVTLGEFVMQQCGLE